jgi:hypothetical protein
MNNNDLPKDQTWSKIVGGSFGAAAFLMALCTIVFVWLLWGKRLKKCCKGGKKEEVNLGV